MKKLPMIVMIVVSIFSAQGALAQDELAMNNHPEFIDYEYELQEYTEVKVLELPLAVHETIARNYLRFEIAEAYISKDNTYKIVLKDLNENTKVVFASANGELIKPNDNKS
ncbi:hypothetical protein J8281_04200 [Aquimarina sp. U1-2]|uniref:hypothetical protein n=1 Tax=Aquimarina sp. U1-2 TaxID=2823141 RepID=UPI001AECF5E3|nr:hypothetical protein [Aquimarina sp. U1-2]MBP2831381.1 hypothetical protein [Aquimarina sp. U1-2]